MTPELIVVSLDYAKLLKEARWPQEYQLFWWLRASQPIAIPNGMIDEENVRNEWVVTHSFADFAAPTASEILGKLPSIINVPDRAPFALYVAKAGDTFNVYYYQAVTGEVLPEAGMEEDTLADTAAAMFVFLQQNHLLPHD
jgi:hypothetical protein